MLKKINTLRVLMRYLKDSDNSILTKILFFVPLVYFISPIDLLPDIFFPFGYLEDIGFLIFGWQAIKGELAKYTRAKDPQTTSKTRNKGGSKGDKDNVIPLHKDDYEID